MSATDVGALKIGVQDQRGWDMSTSINQPRSSTDGPIRRMRCRWTALHNHHNHVRIGLVHVLAAAAARRRILVGIVVAAGAIGFWPYFALKLKLDFVIVVTSCTMHRCIVHPWMIVFWFGTKEDARVLLAFKLLRVLRIVKLLFQVKSA